MRGHVAAVWSLGLSLCTASSVPLIDTLGLENGLTTVRTRRWEAQLVGDAQVLASLRPAGQSFDFLPADYLPLRAGDGQYHWGDITLRYRTDNGTWISADSAARRKAVVPVSVDRNSVLAESKLGPTLPSGPLEVARRWLDVDGDLGLEFTVRNTDNTTIEIGSLGFPSEFNSIFTNRSAEDAQARCSLADPYIGMHGGFVQAAPISGVGPALVVVPLPGIDTPLEAYRNLAEPPGGSDGYATQTFEGLYEWQVLSRAWADGEWNASQPWNPPSSRVLAPGQSLTVGLRFLLADGIRGRDAALRAAGMPVVRAVPGYIVPRDLVARLLVQPPLGSNVTSINVEPAVLAVERIEGRYSDNSILYQLTPSSTAFGRVRVTIAYSSSVQTVHYLITKPAPTAVDGLGRFLTTKQWFDGDDPFGRAPSVMSYDHEAGRIVEQDDRVWIAGLSDEAGAGSFLAAAAKQAIRPDASEIAKLERFVDGVLRGAVQTSGHAVRKSVFFYEPSRVPEYAYDPSLSWSPGWPSWGRDAAFSTTRAYDYVHVAATYWALYRAGRGFPGLLARHGWDWYLNQSALTVARATAVGQTHYADVGWMGETVVGELLADLRREGWTVEADTLEGAMARRACLWSTQAVPFGSEMAWDSTGQEGVYYWGRHFGYAETAQKAVDTVVGFTPTVPHWGWNGNARRYWDNVYGGKLRRIERQIHHYGSALNGLVALAAFRADGDHHLLRIGYAGTTAPLASIHSDGFAAASFHSFPDTLAWDAYSGDYGPGFVGLVLGAATYLVRDPEMSDSSGLVAYGGLLSSSNGTVTVLPRDAARRVVFVGPLGLLVRVDAAEIRELVYRPADNVVVVTLTHAESAPRAPRAVLWIESGDANYTVVDRRYGRERLGWSIPLEEPVQVSIERRSRPAIEENGMMTNHLC